MSEEEAHASAMVAAAWKGLAEERDALRAELVALRAERERTAPLVAAAKAYAEACVTEREAFPAWERADTPSSRDSAWRKLGPARLARLDAVTALREAARALHTDGGTK